MERISFHRWIVDVDPQRTREAHAQLDRGGAEQCGCDPCLNFVAARQQLFNTEFLSLLQTLGVDPTREVEVYHNARLPSGLHSYGGWFHAVGKIVAGGECWREARGGVKVPDLVSVTPHLKVGFRSKCEVVRQPFQGLPLLQLEVQAAVPWVISAHEPS